MDDGRTEGIAGTLRGNTVSDDNDRIPDSAAIAAACLALFLALLIGVMVWHGFQ